MCVCVCVCVFIQRIFFLPKECCENKFLIMRMARVILQIALKYFIIGVFPRIIVIPVESAQIISSTFLLTSQVEPTSDEGMSTEPSAISCAGRCVRDGQCMSIAFDETSGTCWLDPEVSASASRGRCRVQGKPILYFLLRPTSGLSV